MAGFANFISKVKAVLKGKMRVNSWFSCLQLFYPKVERWNWVDLPEAVTLRIFSKLETPEIFVAVRHVCSSWRKLSKEPVLYRSVVLGSKYSFINPSTGLLTEINLSKLIREVVALSCGQMIQFSCGAMRRLNKHDLHNVAASSVSGLKSLRLGVPPDINIFSLTEVITSISSLEELYYSFDVILDSSIEEIGRSCPRLQYFWCKIGLSRSNKEAFAIAKNMPGLRRLCLYGFELTNSGLQAILDGCPHLEYLYLLGCFHINWKDADFWRRKQIRRRIKSIRFLRKKYWEFEFNLKTPLDFDDGRCLRSNMYLAENICEYGLCQYTSQFVDSLQTNHCPRVPSVYDLYMKAQIYAVE